MTDSVRVGVRLRPLSPRERIAAPESVAGTNGTARPPRCPKQFVPAWHADAIANTIVFNNECDVTSVSASAQARGSSAQRNSPSHSFCYDYVFEPTATNEDVYTDLAQPVVDAVLKGYNGTVFAYGQTSSGKTHSMLGDNEDPGVTPRAIDYIMKFVTEEPGARKYCIRVSYCEIYNEVIRDLLNPSAVEVKVREDSSGKTYLESEEVVVTTAEEARTVLERGQIHRAVGETAMNETSSRSHTIFTLTVESRAHAVGAEKSLRSSTLHLVDLAGSERAKSTNATGTRLREGSHINKSLLTLGTIINKLSQSRISREHLPYRDSKLTRVLRHSLGGNARTAVLCAATPSPLHIEETLSTLKFAERAKKVTNTAVRNEVIDYKSKYLEASAEVTVLRSKLAEMVGNEPSQSEHPSISSLPGNLMSQVALTVDLERCREDISFLQERAESAELQNAHSLEILKEKTNQLRAMRARALELREANIAKRGREKALQHSLVEAYFHIEKARNFIDLSKRKGSKVLHAQELLYSVAAKLAMFVPDEEFEKRRDVSYQPGTTSKSNEGSSLSHSHSAKSSVSRTSSMSSSPPLQAQCIDDDMTFSPVSPSLLGSNGHLQSHTRDENLRFGAENLNATEGPPSSKGVGAKSAQQCVPETFSPPSPSLPHSKDHLQPNAENDNFRLETESLSSTAGPSPSEPVTSRGAINCEPSVQRLDTHAKDDSDEAVQPMREEGYGLDDLSNIRVEDFDRDCDVASTEADWRDDGGADVFIDIDDDSDLSIPVIELDQCGKEMNDPGDLSDDMAGNNVKKGYLGAARKALFKRKSKAVTAMRSFYGGAALQDQLSGGRNVTR